MDQLLNVSIIPSEAFVAVGASLAVSVLLQLFKKWLSLQSEKVITMLLVALSFIPVAIEYLVQQAAINPTVLGPRTMLIVGLATVVYRYVTKPITNILNDAKIHRQSLNTQVATAAPIASAPEVAPQPTPAAVSAASEFGAE